MFTLTPLLGARTPSSPAASTLLELDGGIRILVDIGWDASFSSHQIIAALEKHVSTLSIILLTHPTIDHLGAYAWCCKHVPLFRHVPCYATVPVVDLGRGVCLDIHGCPGGVSGGTVPTSSVASADASADDDRIAEPRSPHILLEPPSPDEIAACFNAIHPLKYSQPHQPIAASFSPSVGGLTITAYGAGHTLGGTIWHIQHGLESIVYATDWSQARESLYPGAAWLTNGSEIIEPLRRPTALVCSSKGVEKTEVLSRKKRDDTLFSLVRETIAQGGKVLIPTDSSARVLELAFLLNQTWRENVDGPHSSTYRHCRIYMASRSATTSVRYLNSMLEWVDETVRQEAEAAMSSKGKKGDQATVNPLEWDFVRQIERQSQVQKALNRRRPCVMLASDQDMEWGFSKEVFEGMARDPRNLVLLSERQPEVRSSGRKGLGRQLWELFNNLDGQTSSQSGAKVVSMDGTSVTLHEPKTESLNADELALYQTYTARQQQLHSTLQGDNTSTDPTSAANMTEEADEEDESESEDEDAEHQGRALNLSAQMTQQSKRKGGVTGGALSEAELGINILIRGKGVYDYDVRGKRGREKVFPFVAKRIRDDEFGELIKAEDYLRAEERDEVDGVDMSNRAEAEKKETAVGQKRKWDDIAPANDAKGRKGQQKTQQNKRPKQERTKKDRKPREPDDIDAAIARATGESMPNGGGDPTAAVAAASPAADDESEDSDSDEEDEESDYEPSDQAGDSQGPRKVIWEERTIEVKCRVSFVDFAGLHEKRDLQMIIPLIRPRKLILIAGTESETTLLADECRRLLGSIDNGADGSEGGADVFAPAINEVIDASVDTNAWSLKLSRELVKRLVWQNVKGLGVVAITGQLGAEPLEDASAAQKEDETQQARKKAKLLKPEEQEKLSEPNQPTDQSSSNPLLSTPLLDLPPSATAGNLSAASAGAGTGGGGGPLTRPVHVGDLRLASLRHLLASAGHLCEFRGEGTLLVDGVVVVRKRAGGRLEVESDARGLVAAAAAAARQKRRVSPGSFFKVRDEVYKGLAVVAGV
ncbi:putative cleavage and polyadenylylation specificity factor [Hortaea werneckii]|nr:putative cleavage and polyadenylylation specificity factor [Hortaea werneckii]